MAHDDTSGLEPTSADARRRYPEWDFYYGTPDQLCHARLVVDVHGDSWQDVLDEIQRAVGRLARPRSLPVAVWPQVCCSSPESHRGLG